MKKNYFIVLAILLGLSMDAFSQMENILKQVVVANGGLFETETPTDYVTITSYNPETGTTSVIDTIFTQSVQCLEIYNAKAYVAAQDSVVIYNLDSHERIAATEVSGVNQIKVYRDYLIVGRQFPATNEYVKIFNKNDLSEIVAFEDISGDTYGIDVYNDTIYVAVNGGWTGISGSLVKIYIGNSTPEFIEEMPLGEQALGIAQLYNANNIIYSVNKTPYGGTVGSFTEYHTLTGQVTSTTINFNLGNGIKLVDSKLYVRLNGNIGAFDVVTGEVIDNIVVDDNENLDIMGAAFDEIAEKFYVNFSTYFAAGEGKVFDLEGNVVDTYEAGISAEAIALDYRLVGSVSNSLQKNILVNTYPNPMVEELNVFANERITSLSIYNISGNVVSDIKNIDTNRARIMTSELKQGVYILSIETKKGIVAKRVIKK